MRDLGDKVFIAWASPHYGDEVDCPVCFGRRFVHIVLGDDSLEKVACGNCSRGCSPPTGKVTERVARCGVTEAEVVGVTKRGDAFRYEYSPSAANGVGVFDTEEEALAAAEAALPGVAECRAMIDAGVQHDKWESSTWSVGYHRRCIRDAERQIAWHRQQLGE